MTELGAVLRIANLAKISIKECQSLIAALQLIVTLRRLIHIRIDLLPYFFNDTFVNGKYATSRKSFKSQNEFVVASNETMTMIHIFNFY